MELGPRPGAGNVRPPQGWRAHGTAQGDGGLPGRGDSPGLDDRRLRSGGDHRCLPARPQRRSGEAPRVTYAGAVVVAGLTDGEACEPVRIGGVTPEALMREKPH
ncbi:uncharacterized protein LY79DRAFT_113024 [Colletotrichum navitas]|uniref:Uncharacterized protein n=1 Tax=Colletotrichum navitas TaxID=681940 RepID=A0AAD8PJV9_9PEZI|nr:uncharacterized protein LY79DRAFT_113024 [Colletotrichum navitas]KAK1566068.1 hypothetical protein LY79DRAFT_113024 [Colletotrichum navitas]